MKATLTVAILSIAMNALSFIPILAWLSVPGFVLGITAWVMGRKLLSCNQQSMSRLIMILGIVGTFFGVATVIYNFVMGGMLYGALGLASL